MIDGPQGNTLRRTDYVVIALVFAFLGAFFWAIRGTGGYGGASGGTLAGLGWAMLWFGFSRFAGGARQRPYGSGHIIAAIAIGIAFGGLTGYGVYTAWVRGLYYLDYPNGERPIGAWTGYAMLFVCGLHWGGVPGAFMAWVAPRRPMTWLLWGGRWAAGIGAAVFAGWFVRQFPQLFLPFYGEGLYVEANPTAIRAEGSIQNIAPHVGLFLGFLGFEIARRDWRAVKIMLTMSLGFAIPFTIGGWWHTWYLTDLQLPWWKFWEMSIGFGGGLAFGLAFYWFNQHDAEAAPRPVTFVERCFAAGLIVWWASGSVVSNAFEGFRRLHELDWSDTARAILWMGFLVVTGVPLVIWLVRTRGASQQEAPTNASVLPWAVIPAVIGLIIVCGYLVSVPPEWERSNYVLVSMYTVYLIVTAGLLAYLRLRGNKAP